MRITLIILFAFLTLNHTYSQSNNNALPPATAPNTENIYEIKKQYLTNILHNPTEKEVTNNDNELKGFDRWYNFVAPRCYPTGNMPRPDVLLHEYLKEKNSNRRNTARTTSGGVGNWQPLGPSSILTGIYGIGRINCIVIDPVDTATLYIGAACGGVNISHDAGATWTSNCDNFPSLSIADIAVNPHHTDTIYAATGDGYGYEISAYNIFWGGLYSAGIMMSADGGATWNPTSFSFLQSNNQIIQKLLIHPNHPNILLAATRTGIYRTTDAGATWHNVFGGHVVSMAFHPGQQDTVYAIDTSDLIISYDAGATWTIKYSSVNGGNTMRSTLAVSKAAPKDVWILEYNDGVYKSNDEGNSFNYIGTPTTTAGASFYGYYDMVFAISPTDSNYLLAGGIFMYVSTDGGVTWNFLDPSYQVHPDNHAFAFNPIDPSIIYDGNDGGIFVTRDAGTTFNNLSNGLMISQIYRMASSIQNPYRMLCGVQDNGSFYNNGTGSGWTAANDPLGDGMDCAIHPLNDYIQIASTQYGNFYISTDQGVTFNSLPFSGVSGNWTAPVVFDPNDPNTFFMGLTDIYVSHDMGTTFTNLTMTTPFNSTAGLPGAVSMALSPRNTNVLYGADNTNVLRTTDGGATWTTVTGNLPTNSLALNDIAVDARDPMLVYAVMSGYSTGKKVYVSTTGGTIWNNISHTLPNLPVDCITTDSLIAGAIFIGTDMGVYYIDSTMTDWAIYAPGLPNVVVDHIDINATNRKVRAATYGRGIWECNMLPALYTPNIKNLNNPTVQLLPNPTTAYWTIVFPKQRPDKFSTKLMDVTGKIIAESNNSDVIDASKLASGIYDIQVVMDGEKYDLKAIRK